MIFCIINKFLYQFEFKKNLDIFIWIEKNVSDNGKASYSSKLVSWGDIGNIGLSVMGWVVRLISIWILFKLVLYGIIDFITRD